MTLSRQKLTLIGIFVLFMGPVLLVMLMRSQWWDYQPGGLKNHGHLVQPPLQLALEKSSAIERKWLVLYVLEQPCEEVCLNEVTALRQIHKAAGRRAENLEVVLLSSSIFEKQLTTQLDSIYPDFELLSDTEGKALDTLISVNEAMQAGQNGFEQVRTYVVDPNFNVVLAYRVDADPNDLHKDLKRLLKWADQENR